ncbi:MAG: LLM class flavin-dependent oxidoreductase [Hyphomicrobiaceae bacterium]
MRYGIWTPLPHTVQPEPALNAAVDQLVTHGRSGEPDLSLRFAADVLQRAEDYGFDLTLIAQRWLGSDPDCLILGTALAAMTRNMHIMPALHPGIVPPQVAAKLTSTLDRISGGRLCVNIVTGWWRDEFNLFTGGGYIDDEDARFRRVDEYIQVLKGMWEQPTFSLKGEFYDIDGIQLLNRPAQAPHPPLYAASRHEQGKDIIARTCDVWFVPVSGGIDRYQENFAAIEREVEDMRKRAAHYGRTLGFGISAHVMCAPSDKEAHASAMDLENYGKENRLASIAAKALGAGLFGSPGTIAKRLQRYESIGIDTLMLHFHPMIEGLDAFGQEVMPMMGDSAPAAFRPERSIAR